MPLLPLVLFALTYLGLALGRIPPFKLDRSGFALFGAVAFLATESISVDQAKAAVDAPTLAVLFGMMMLSAQYRVSGLYTAIGDRLARVEDPRWLLLGTIAVSALLSAVLTNDVVCFALTPLLAGALVQSGRPPLPYLLAVACASNIGSALTPIGNPRTFSSRNAWGFVSCRFFRPAWCRWRSRWRCCTSSFPAGFERKGSPRLRGCLRARL